MKYCDTCHSTYPNDFAVCPKDKAALTPLHELRPGAVIRDKYEIMERVGVGGMATVYRAKHLTFNEIKAIKVVSSKLMDDEAFLKRFKAEAIITRKLQHPNAVQLDDFDTTPDGRPFIVMEYVQGRNLRSWIHDLGTLPVPRALSIAKQVAAALGAAHKLGIVHRDIKPDNIIVIPQQPGSEFGADLVKVFDFGIAKMRHNPGSMDTDISGHTPTQAGMVVGTPQYVSPEQASGKIGDQIDGRSDLYSLGVVLYEMITGHLPFTSDTPVGYLIHHMQTAPTPPSALKPPVHIPDSVNAVLMKALEKNRDKRFQTAEEMIAALNRPHSIAPTAVLGSDSLNAPTAVRTAPATRTAVTGTRPAPPPAKPAPVYGGYAPPPKPAAKPAGAVHEETETVFDESKHHGPQVFAHVDWKKVFTWVVAVMAILVVGSFILQKLNTMRPQPPVDTSASANPEEDARLKSDVEDALAGSDSLKRAKIEVQARNGQVTLSGKVNKPYMSAIAGALARDVNGVKYVQNDIEVIEVQEPKEPVWRSEARKNNAPSGAYPPAQTGNSPAQPGPAAGNADLRMQVREFNVRGYKRLAAGDYTGAERAFRNALSLEPNNQAALTGLRRAQAGQH